MEKEILIKLREAIDGHLTKLEGGEAQNGNNPIAARD